MSHNQSRSERNDSSQYRKTARSGSSNQRGHYQGSIPVKGGGGAPSAASDSSTRSFKKYPGTAQWGQSRARNPDVDLASATQASGNRGESHVLPADSNSNAAVVKDIQTLKVTKDSDSTFSSSNVSALASLSYSSSVTSDSKVQATPAKEDASRSFPLQFGSINAGVVNGVQIPARTSSAPPNLDEQKKSQQVHPVPARAAPGIPNPSLLKQHLLKKNEGSLDHRVADEAQQQGLKSTRETQPSAAPPKTQSQKPAAQPVSSMPMQMSFHHPQLPIQFGGPSPQIHSQTLPGASIPIPIPMHIPMGNPPMQQPIFIPGLQPHPMQSQEMMLQAQGFNLPGQMAHQMTPQLGSAALNFGHHYSPQQVGKHSTTRKPVKITHPDTHEELKLEVSPGPKPHLNVPPQSQTIQSFPPNYPMNFYPNSYNINSMFFPALNPVAMSSSHVPSTSQLPRFYNQDTVKPTLGSHFDKDLSSASSSTADEEGLFPPKRDLDLSSSSSVPQSKVGSVPSVTLAVSSDSLTVQRDGLNTQDIASSSASSLEEVSDTAVDCFEHKQSKMGCKQEPDFNSPSMLQPSQLSEAEIVKKEPTSSGSHLIFETANVSPPTSASATMEISDTMNGAADALNFDETSGNCMKRGVHVSIASEEKGETDIERSLVFDGNHPMEASLSYQEIPLTVDKTSEDELSSCISDTLSSNKDKDREILDHSDDVLIVGTLDKAMKLESASASDTSVTCDDFPVLENQAYVSGTFLIINGNNGKGNSDIGNTDVSMKPQDGVGDKSSDALLSPPSFMNKVISDIKMEMDVGLQDMKINNEFSRKAEADSTLQGSEKPSSYGENQASAEVPLKNDVSNEKSDLHKVEPDDSEDAPEISIQAKNSKSEEVDGRDVGGNDLIAKKYSRKFLLKFEEECCDLPEGFEVPADIADVLVASNIHGMRDSYPSPGRNIDRSVGGSRVVRRPSGFEDDEKWSKFPGPLTPGKGDFREDMGYGSNVVGFRPGQVGNFGATRAQRPQMHLQYPGGILSGPVPNMAVQGGLQRNYSDSDRWQRGAGFQRGLMPSPHTPQMMKHRAEKKYEVGKVTDEEEGKQRQLKAILNKLTPQNFEKLFQRVKEVNIDNVVTLRGVISQIFDKALMEPTFCEMYADFCLRLAADLPELVVDDQTITFKRLLLNKCQEEFEKREIEEEEANKVEEEGESKDSPLEREEKRLRVRRRMLGNIRLIGELYKKRMLTERIMHGCINKLLGHHENPDEENIEALCKLMSTIGEIIDHQKAKVHMDAYFQNMAQLSNNTKLSSRVRFMLKDTIDLRKNKWQQRRKVEGPKKIEEVHRDAAQERHTQSTRMSRAPGGGGSIRRSSHSEFTSRAPSMLSPPGSHVLHPQRAYGSQDVWMDERHPFENRTTAIPLPQRPIGDDCITLGPQGVPVRGMASRVQPSAPTAGLNDTSVPGERVMGLGVNGLGSRTSYDQSHDPSPRYPKESFHAPSAHDQLQKQEKVSFYGNREVSSMDHIFDGSVPMSSPGQVGSAGFNNASSEDVLSDEQLRSKSIAAIKEFYSAKDENEVILCIKELNAPSFYPSMISSWVTDSFEQKDVQRNLLANLLISITKPQVGILNGDHLISGFASVLTLLEDAVNDAPRATEFLGRLFARMITADIVSFSGISRILYEGGEEPGRLVEIGLAAEVVGFILDSIETEKGESVLKDTISGSSIRLGSFRPPGSNKQTRLDKYI